MSDSYYVKPDGTLIWSGDMTAEEREQSGEWWGNAASGGPYSSTRAGDTARAVAAGTLPPTPAKDKAERAAGITVTRAARSAMTSQVMQRRAIATAVIGVVVLIIGYIVAGATSSGNALCTSALGELGSAFDTTVAHDCGAYETFNSLGSVFIGIGWTLTVVGGILVALAIGHKYVTSQGQ